jgi:signal transduction histidine kinase
MEPVEIESVMVNLLDNALYALMPAGGTIEVIAHNVLLDRAIPGVLDTVIPAGHWVAVSVVDNGPGIAFEVAKRLFVPYNTSKPLGKGTGLGLATIKHILVSNGGGIRFRSVPANGACFRFYLPVLSKDLPKQSS